MTTLNERERQYAQLLLSAVKNKEFTVTYSDLADRVNPQDNPRNVGRNIEHLSILCHELGLPLLSAMVVSKATGNAGEGFYLLYEKLGIPTGGRSEKELCYAEHNAIRDCKEWYKLEDALGLHVGMPRPQKPWIYIKQDMAEKCLHALESVLESFRREGDPSALSFASGELARRERYKYDVAERGNAIMHNVPWSKPGIENNNAIFKAASDALHLIPEGWNRQQNLVDWHDVDYIWEMKQTRPFMRALNRLYATDDEKGAFADLNKAVGGRFAFISYFYFLKDPDRYAVMRPIWFKRQLLRLGAPTTCTDRCSWENYQLYLAILREVREFLSERLDETVTLIDAHSFVFSLYLVDEYKKAERADNANDAAGPIKDDLESRVIVTGKEGKRIAYYTTKYERKPQNRDAAIRIHGYKCAVCGFDYAERYGDLGKGFIEVHHIKPLYSLDEEITPDPATDMVCLCANCHRMIHRKKDGIMTVEELRKIVEGR